MSIETIIMSKEAETSVWCGKCGAGLCSNSKWDIDVDTARPYVQVTVDPCEKCLQDSFDEGKEEGNMS